MTEPTGRSGPGTPGSVLRPALLGRILPGPVLPEMVTLVLLPRPVLLLAPPRNPMRR